MKPEFLTHEQLHKFRVKALYGEEMQPEETVPVFIHYNLLETGLNDLVLEGLLVPNWRHRIGMPD
jgi:hypothetical protein